MIQVQDGDRLTGHCVGGGDYPELLVYDGQGPGGGSLMFSMGSFHWCGVHITRNIRRNSGSRTRPVLLFLAES